jgi:putative transposase
MPIDPLEELLADWLKLGVVQKSDSLYSSQVFCVPKKGGNGYQIVQDFRELNPKSLMDMYAMKDIHESIGDIGQSESTIFTTLELASGFWQVPLNPNSVPKTAFTLPGLDQYEWLMSPMGIIGCPASFQQLMQFADTFPNSRTTSGLSSISHAKVGREPT